MGASGRGKTTLLHLLAGLLKPDSGIITGIKKDRRVSVVFQEDRLLPKFSALQNASIVLKTGDTKQKAAAMLQKIGLGDVIHHPIEELSGGMKRRVAIARALLYEPDILIMDEPFKGLDTELKHSVIELVQSLTADTTLIFASHDISEAKAFAAEIIVL